MADVEKNPLRAVTLAIEGKNYAEALAAALKIVGSMEKTMAGSRGAILSVLVAQDLEALRPQLVPEQFKSVSKDGVSVFFQDPRLQLMRILLGIANDCGDAEAAQIIDAHAKSLFQK